MPKISIIVPVYNVEEYLENCINSILNQTFKDFELILVNDGSTDKSLDICKHYKNIDDRIYIIDKKNGGLSSARNVGLDIAKGEYIAFVDSDDYIHPQMYEILYNVIIKNDADMSLCDFKKVFSLNENLIFYDKSNDEFMKIEYLTNIESLHRMNQNNGVVFVVAWNKLYKRELFNNLRYKEGIIHEDEYIVHRILYAAKKINYIHKELYFYMQRGGSIMNNRTDINRIDYWFALSDRIRFFDKIGLKKLQYRYEEKYLYEMFSMYPKFSKYKNIKKKLLVRFDFLKLIKVLIKNKNHSTKEKVMWVIFCLNPNIYIRYISCS